MIRRLYKNLRYILCILNQDSCTSRTIIYSYYIDHTLVYYHIKMYAYEIMIASTRVMRLSVII